MPKKQMPKNETVQVKKRKNFCKRGGDNNQQTQTDEMLNVETINARVKNIQENLEKLSKTVNDVRKTVNDNKTNTNIDSASIAHWVLKLEKEVEKVMGTNPVAPSVNKTINGINGVVYDKIHAQQNKLKPQTSTINTQNKFKQLAQQNMNTILQDNSLDKNDFPLKLRELDNLDNLDNLDATATNRERVPINQGTEITNRVSKNLQENKKQAVGGKKNPKVKNPKKK